MPSTRPFAVTFEMLTMQTHKHGLCNAMTLSIEGSTVLSSCLVLAPSIKSGGEVSNYGQTAYEHGWSDIARKMIYQKRKVVTQKRRAVSNRVLGPRTSMRDIMLLRYKK